MSKWNIVNDIKDLPRDCYPFLALWKGRISICQFNDDEDHFYISFDPAQYDHNWKVSKEREGKFTHWMELPDMPEDY